MKSTIFSLLFALPSIALIWVLYYFSDAPNRHLAIILTVNIILYAVIFHWLPKNKLQILFGSVAITTGFYAFKYLTIEDYSTFNAVYSTFRLFLLDVDAVFHPSGSRFITYPLALEIARFSAAACTISTIFLLIFSYFGQSVKLLAYSLFGRHTVVIGYNRHSKILIENLCEQEQKVVLLTEDISDSQKAYLQSLGVIVFVGKQGEAALYKKCSLAKADVLIIFYEDDSKNLNELLAIHNALQKDWSTLPIKQVIIHLTHTQSSALFDLINSDLFQENTITFKPFNLYNLAAHTILMEQPLYKGYEQALREASDEPFHLLFVGFGQTGKHMAIQAIEQCHFLNSAKLQIRVLDQEAENVQKNWYDSFPKSNKFVDIEFESFNSNTHSISDYIRQAKQPFTHVFICMSDDFQDLKEGITLAANEPNLPIYLKIGEEGQLSEWLHENKTSFSNLYLFGDSRSVLDYDHIINNKQEALAKRIHDGYRQLKEKQTGATVKKWEEISDFEKESNRNQFHHAYVKLMLLGLRAVKKEHSIHLQSVSFSQYKEIASEKLEALAASEHQRWNTFHYIRGWDTLQPINGELRDAKNKRHGCLVPYEELDQVSELFGQDYKQYDRDVVFNLYDNMMMLGYVIEKDS